MEGTVVVETPEGEEKILKVGELNPGAETDTKAKE
jgi:hypothetical protein